MGDYDICVEYDTLCDISDKLKKIEYDIDKSTDRMKAAIQRAQDFLAGNQFEKAKNTTMSCVEITNRTQINLKKAENFIEKLREIVEEYGKCTYSGD